MEIEETIYANITKLSKEGDALAERKQFAEALKKYNEALELVPVPKTDWEAATWLYAAIGDSYFFAKQFVNALNAFREAYKCPDGISNPFINLRIGECYFEMGDLENAEEYLLRAYMWEGAEIFKNENKRYIEFMARKYDIS